MSGDAKSTSPRVRMYRQGLGDCFLISLPRERSSPLHMLIDCGVLLGTKDADEKMVRVAHDIQSATGGRIDIVVATHEHWDHLSGFLQARAVFDRMTIGEVWFAWTEDPGDSLARHLRQQRDRSLRGLRLVAGRLADVDARAAEQLRGPLSFFGAVSGQTTRDALDYLAHHPSEPVIRYHRPGEPALELPGIRGAHVYVLGPPRDEDLLHRCNPTKSGHEVYELAHAMGLLAAAALVGADDHESELEQAFERRYRVPPDEAGARSFFQKTYYQSSEDWRRIDADWLAAAEHIALALDSATNNTSLALAIELEPHGRVLLFPGDAQVGNWLSWGNYGWMSAARSGKRTTASDLLGRTVLYKVGHHGSHNATLREHGLEQMIGRELVAMVPVDHEMAERKRWNMPFPALCTRLSEIAHGRVIRADQGLPTRPADVSASEWQEFTARVNSHDLYHEYVLPAARS